MGYAEFWLAQKEFWPQLGLTVDVKPAQGGAQSVQAVASGADPVGHAEFIPFLEGVQQGLPITALLVTARRDSTGLIFMESSGIKSWKDVAGWTIALNPGSPQAKNMLESVARKEGVDPGQIRLVSAEGSRETLLIEKKIDGFFGYARAQDVWMRCAGQQGATSWRFADHGFDVYGQVVIANTNWLKTVPEDVVTRLVLGITQAAVEMKKNPERTFKVMADANPGAELDRSQLVGVADDGYVRWSWDAPSKPFQEKGWGWIDAEQMELSQSRLVEAGLLKDKLPVDRYYTTTYLEHPAVRQAALGFNQASWGPLPADLLQQCGLK
jgi:ABC-type nitrate/sulfonate/bicarbonate transport system substrate-binding protein